MATDLYPYSGRSDGDVSDAEHETLWSPWPDGILPDQPATALAVSVDPAAHTWTVQAGQARVAGHVWGSDAAITRPITPNSGSGLRVDRIVAEIDHGASPWVYDATAVEGSPGGGVPALSTDRAGRWQFLLAAINVDPSGAVTLRSDNRVWATASGTRCQSTSRPARPIAGDLSWESDTNRVIQYDGSQWNVLAAPATSWDTCSLPDSLTGPVRVRAVNVGGLRRAYMTGSLTRRDKANFSAGQMAGGQLARVPTPYRPTGTREGLLLNSLAGGATVPVGRGELGTDGWIVWWGQQNTSSSWVSFDAFAYWID